MHSNWETFITTYNKAPEDVRAVVDSDAIPEFAELISTKFQISPSEQSTLVAQLSDLVVGLVNVDVLAKRITDEQHISTEETHELTQMLSTFLKAPLRPLSSTNEPAESIPSTQTQLVKETPQVSRLRTMQSDAERIHGYGAYRKKFPDADEASAPSSKLRPLADLPRYEKGD